MISRLASPGERNFVKAIMIVLVTAFAGISLASSGFIALSWIRPHWPAASWALVMAYGAVLAILQVRLAATASSQVPGVFAEDVLTARVAGHLAAYSLRSAWMILVALMLGALAPLLVETLIFPIWVPRLIETTSSASFSYLALYLNPVYRPILIAAGAVLSLALSWGIAGLSRWPPSATSGAAGLLASSLLVVIGVDLILATSVGVLAGVFTGAISYLRNRGLSKERRADKRVAAVGLITLILIGAWVDGTWRTGSYIPRQAAAARSREGYYQRIEAKAQEQSNVAARLSDALDNAAERMPLDGQLASALGYTAGARGGETDRCKRAEELLKGLAPLDVILRPDIAFKSTSDFYRFRRECRRSQEARDRRLSLYSPYPAAFEPKRFAAPAWLDTIPTLLRGKESHPEAPSLLGQTGGALIVGMWVFFSFFSPGQVATGPIYANERRRSLLIGGVLAILLCFALFAGAELAVERTFGPLRAGLWQDYFERWTPVPVDLIGSTAILYADRPSVVTWLSVIWTTAFLALFVTFIEFIRRSIETLSGWFKVGWPIRWLMAAVCIASALAGVWLSSSNGTLEAQIGIFAIMAILQAIIVVLVSVAIWRVRSDRYRDRLLYEGGLYVVLVVAAVGFYFLANPPTGVNMAASENAAFFALVLSAAMGTSSGLFFFIRNRAVQGIGRRSDPRQTASARNKGAATAQRDPLRLLLTQGLFGSEAAFRGALEVANETGVAALIVLGPLHARSITLYEELGGQACRVHELPLGDKAPGLEQAPDTLQAWSAELRRREDANLATYSFGADAALLAQITKSQPCWDSFLRQLGTEVARKWEHIAEQYSMLPIIFADSLDAPKYLEAASRDRLEGTSPPRICFRNYNCVGDHEIGVQVDSGGNANARRVLSVRTLNGSLILRLGSPHDLADGEAWVHHIPFPASAADGGGFRGLLLVIDEQIDYLTVFQ